MTALSTHLGRGLADHVLGGPDYTRPGTVYIALFTTAPNANTGSGGVEVTGGSYARVAVSNTDVNFPAATGTGSKTNGTAINFPAPSADWGTVVAAAIYDAATGGNLLMSGNLQSSRVVVAGSTVRFPANTITFTLD